MGQVLNYFPGQLATIFLQTVDGYGNRVNSDNLPVITRVLLPNLTFATGFPATMHQIDVGLYYGQFQLPTGAASVGSYLVDVQYDNPADGYASQYEIFQIIVQAPFGNYGVLPIG